MKINWKVRIANKQFWLSVIPAVLLVIQAVGAVFGNLGNKLLDVVNAIFALLVILGVVVDHTTQGVSDSERAQQYDKPVK